MGHSEIGQILRKCRTEQKLSVKQVEAKLKEHNCPYSIKTIYGWENGSTQPNADVLMLLCKIYKIDDVLGCFGYRDEQDSCKVILTNFEKQLILNYREKPEMQNAVCKLLDLNGIV